MISSYLVDIDGKGYREPFVTEIPQIRKTYPKSGLYKNDGSTLPVWTVEWFAQEVEPLSDGIHIVRCGPWASSPFTQAVTFFTIKSVGHTQALSIIQKA